jgi:hypothetical protein
MARKNCAFCNKEFHTRPQGQHARFCSDACRKNNHRAEKMEETTLTLQFGKVTVKVVDLEPTRDKEKLRQTIIDTLGPELIAKVSALEPPQHIGGQA